MVMDAERDAREPPDYSADECVEGVERGWGGLARSVQEAEGKGSLAMAAVAPLACSSAVWIGARRAGARVRCDAGARMKVKVAPAVVVGAGRMGQALVEMGAGEDLLLRRGERVPEGGSGPILVCTRNNDLDAVVDATPESRRDDLVFIQNGMLEPWLERRGLAQATQVLAYFAVSKLGEAPVDGKTDVNPGGLTAASGKWSEAVAARLQGAGLSCKVLAGEEFQKAMLEKLIWLCAFMLVGARHQGATVGDVERIYRDEVEKLILELAAAASLKKGLQFDAGLEERLCAYARSVSHFPTAVKEFEWRNGWFYAISLASLEKGDNDPAPLHTSWLKELGLVV